MSQTRSKVYLTIGLLWLTGVLAAGQFAKIAVMLPFVRDVYPGVGPEIGFLVSSLSVIGMVFGLLAGIFTSIFGYRKLLLGAVLFGGTLSILQSVFPSFGVMLLSRVAEGASHLAIVVAAPTLIGQIAPIGVRSTAMTLWSTVFTVAFALFAWIGLPLVGRVGLQTILFGHGVMLIAMGAGLSRVLPKLVDARAQVPSWSATIARHKAAYASPFIFAPAAGWLFYAMSFVALVSVLPEFLPPQHRTFLTGFMSVAALIVSMTVGVQMLRTIPPVTVLLIGFAGGVCCTILLATGLAPSWAAVAMLGALGLVQAGSFSAIPALNTRVEDQALANGALAQAGNTGNVIGTPLLLWLVEMFGFGGLIGFALFAFTGAITVHLWLAGRRRKTNLF